MLVAISIIVGEFATNVYRRFRQKTDQPTNMGYNPTKAGLEPTKCFADAGMIPNFALICKPTTFF